MKSLITFIDSVYWEPEAKKLCFEQSVEADTRRYRAKEVVETYKVEIEKNLLATIINFSEKKVRVELYSNQVGCSCPDFLHRRISCKHIFGSAYLCGDKSVILDKPPPSARTADKPKRIRQNGQVDQERKWHSKIRPQDIYIGKYFLLSDFLYSLSGVVKGIPNNVLDYEGKVVESLRKLAEHILDPVVEEFGIVSITYGYVCPELHAKIYGEKDWLGVHNCTPVKEKGATMAAAADILVHSQRDNPRLVLKWIKDNCEYDRLIIYPGSPIICTAWADKPRYHCKEWIFPDSFSKALYINAKFDDTINPPKSKNPSTNTEVNLDIKDDYPPFQIPLFNR